MITLAICAGYWEEVVVCLGLHRGSAKAYPNDKNIIRIKAQTFSFLYAVAMLFKYLYRLYLLPLSKKKVNF